MTTARLVICVFMPTKLQIEIDELVKEIDRLKAAGDPEERISDMNEYLRVLYLKLKMELQGGEKPWETSGDSKGSRGSRRAKGSTGTKRAR
jgi:hypothetical protein